MKIISMKLITDLTALTVLPHTLQSKNRQPLKKHSQIFLILTLKFGMEVPLKLLLSFPVKVLMKAKLRENLTQNKLFRHL
jgi:hypothetical protein